MRVSKLIGRTGGREVFGKTDDPLLFMNSRLRTLWWAMVRKECAPCGAVLFPEGRRNDLLLMEDHEARLAVPEYDGIIVLVESDLDESQEHHIADTLDAR